ncbi:hypothetical protein ACFQMA_03395 [Halosimplex aquaticum]|uniref:DUF7527 domain-containing protein n=1 Tax=Halosimplex aquaticum TaxID=3026162 RepID=A0ABD5Y0N1_9EURY|nr:hypothetical protein [Halosimplex aquaticum]
MTTRAVEQFDEWESSPFRDGYRGLHDLAEGEFSGIVEAGGAKLCMLNGTVVGILDGDIDSFEDATGTAYEAPSPALPLLALMQERNDEVRAKYYSEDTPLTEVDDTLADGGFTGFVELSENVLSGDYYVVYHRGRSMAVAWVGNSSQLLTDDEAFDRADDEVGIFEVRPAEIEPVEIPEVESEDAVEPDATAGDATAGGAAASGATEPATDESDDADATASAEGGAATADDAAGADPAGTADADGSSAADGEAETQSTGASASAEMAESASSEAGSSSAASSVTDSAGESADTTAGSTADEEPTEASARGVDDATDRDTGRDPARTDDRGAADDAPAGPTESGSDAREGEPAEPSTGRQDEPAGSGRRRDHEEPSGPETARDERPRSEERASRTRESELSSRSGDGASSERTDRTAEPSRTERTTEADGTDRTAESERPRSDRSESRSASRSTESHREAGRERTDSSGGSSSRTPASTGRADESTASAPSPDTSASGTGSAGTPEQLATHSIPSLDPARTTSRGSESESSPSPAPTAEEPPATDASTATTASAEERPAGSANGPTEPATGRQNGRSTRRDQPAGAERTDARQERAAEEPQPADAGTQPSSDRVADLEAELEEREAEIERLEADLAAAETERDDLRAELESVRSERDDLRSRLDPLESERDQLEAERDDLAGEVDELEAEVERLESQLQEIEAEFGDAVDAERRMSPGEALDQTNLFVRYESKGKATLETAHAGDASREKVGENLGLEYHTQFDRDNVSVGGLPFDEFLRETIQFQFVTWVINDLLYEIRDTGKVAELQALYDAIPKIDRAELNGTVSTEYTEDGQERRSQESFDVVMRDRMGNPLLTANMNDSRQAASESMMSALVTASSHVGESTETLGASFLVTSSFFEPEALETAAEATSGGLLSRDKRESFVKLSRKQGYHLCLVEAREDKFHLAVPEL